MKKILFVANVDKEHILKFHIPTFRLLKNNGWIVHVACSGNEEIPFCDYKWNMNYGRSPYNINTLTSISKLKKILESEKYDIVHCHTPTGGFVTRIASFLSKYKENVVIYTAHGYHFYKGSPKLNWLLYFTVEWILSYLTDCIITINNEDYFNTLKYNFGMKRLVKLNGVGVDLQKYRTNYNENEKKIIRNELGLNDESKVLIYIAELNVNKNQEFLLKVFKKLCIKYEKCELLLVGPDKLNGYHEKLARELNILQKVKFLGWREDIDRLLSISDVAVSTSKREGLGLNIIEAIASGVPVVAIENRGHLEIIKSGYSGFLIKNYDIDDMIRKIILLIEDSVTRENIIKNGINEIERFDYNKIIPELWEIYDQYTNLE